MLALMVVSIRRRAVLIGAACFALLSVGTLALGQRDDASSREPAIREQVVGEPALERAALGGPAIEGSAHGTPGPEFWAAKVGFGQAAIAGRGYREMAARIGSGHRGKTRGPAAPLGNAGPLGR
jgi:hypothetical protein